MIFDKPIYGFDSKKNKEDIAEPINLMEENLNASITSIRSKLPKHYLFDPESEATEPNQTEFTVEIPNFNYNSVVIGIRKQSKTDGLVYSYAPATSKPITAIEYDSEYGVCYIVFADGFEAGYYYDIVFCPNS